jgi:hypothetical protein
MPDHYETPHGHSKPPETKAIGEPIQITPTEGQSTGDASSEILLNRYYRLHALLENFGFNKTEGDDLPEGNSWFNCSCWPTTVNNRSGIFLECLFVVAKIEAKINRETRVLEDFRVKMQKENPVVPGKTMTVERPIAFWDLVLNYKPSAPCDWDSIVAELKPLALLERSLALGEQVARSRDHEKMIAQMEARNDPTAVVRAAVSELVRQLKPQEAK